MQTTIQRLSSGLRINSAKDDAAGLAISERFTSQIRGTNQALRNASDGISLAQVAEGAQAGSAGVLQRIRKLAVQSANASKSAGDRKALQAEVAELDRTALGSLRTATCGNNQVTASERVVRSWNYDLSPGPGGTIQIHDKDGNPVGSHRRQQHRRHGGRQAAGRREHRSPGDGHELRSANPRPAFVRRTGYRFVPIADQCTQRCPLQSGST